MKKIQVISSYFWPYLNTNGIVISKKIYNLCQKKGYNAEVYTYCLKNTNLKEQQELINKSRVFKIHKIAKFSDVSIIRIIKSVLSKINDKNEEGIVISYHHLYETAYFAYFFKNKRKWVAIFSDPPMHNSPFNSKKRKKRERIRLYIFHSNFLLSKIPMAIIKKNADKFVFNDIWQAKFILGKQYSKYEHKIFINQMGYDDEFINQIPTISEKKSKKVQLAYFGNLYGPRSGKEFVYAVQKLLEKQLDINFEVHIYGNNRNAEIKVIIDQDEQLKSIFYLHDQITYQESIDKMQQADILLVLDADLLDQTDIYPYTPSKIIDYISVKKPIFGISMENSPTRDICEDTNNWWSSFDEKQICNTFIDCLQNYKNHQYDEEKYYKYSLDHQNELFDEMLQSLMNEKE